jgi:hypothetical protein
MKRLLLILILTFSFQSLSKADDIREFEIEGMSVGDSLLNFMTKDEILDKIELNKDVHFYLTDKFSQVYKYNGLSKYHLVSFYIKKRDKDFKIYGITGSMEHVENITECHEQMDEIAQELSKIFKDTERKEANYNHAIDKSGRSKVKEIYFLLKTKSKARIVCMDFEENLRKKNNWIDGLDISLQTNDVTEWFNNR